MSSTKIPLTLAIAILLLPGGVLAALGDPPTKPGGASFGIGSAPTGESLVATEIVADVAKIEAGKPFRIFVVFKVAPHWHIYWKNSGDSGLPPTVAFELPAGFSAGPLEFPCPTVEQIQDETNYIFEGEVALAITVTPPSDASKIPASARFDAKIAWLVCKGSCLTGKREQSLTLSTATPITSVDSRVAGFVSALPKPADRIGVSANVQKDTLVITVPSALARFIPAATPGVTYGKPSTQTVDGRVIIRVPLTIQRQNSLGQPLLAAGAVIVDDKASPRVFAEIQVPIAAGAAH